MSLGHRIDTRTEKEFAGYIKEMHKKELEIAIRYCIYLFNKTGVWPELIPTGTDFTGEIRSKASSIPDFSIDGIYIEVTQSAKFCLNIFHEKKTKIKNCIKNDSIMLFVNGFDTDDPVFTEMTSDILKTMTNKSISKYGENVMLMTKRGPVNKPVYRYDIGWFSFNPLPPMMDKLPEDYKKLLRQIK